MMPGDLRAKVEAQMGGVRRSHPAKVEEALRDIGVDPASEFGKFFSEYVITFYRSQKSFVELCDLLEPNPEVLLSTKFVREAWGLPDRYVCFSVLQGEGGYLYDRQNGWVFDFDLSDLEELLSGRLQPGWKGFFEFMEWYL